MAIGRECGNLYRTAGGERVNLVVANGIDVVVGRI